MTNIFQTISLKRCRQELGVFTKFALEASTLSQLSNIRILIMENLLSLAETSGFLVQSDRHGNRQVLPQQPTEKWKLQQTEDRWLLIIGNVPQVKLHLDDAIAFLKRRLLTHRYCSKSA
jgi:hypothetical protein